MLQTDVHEVLEKARSLIAYPDKVISLCDELFERRELASRLDVRCRAHLLKGGALRTKGQVDLAECELLQAICIAEQLNDAKHLADTASQLALLHLHGHDYERARRYFTMARNRYIEVCSVEGVAQANYNMATLLMMENRQAEAMILLEEAMQGYNEAGSTNGMTHVLTAMAIVRLKQREYEQALDHLQRSAQLFRSLDQLKHELTVELNIAECYIHLKQFNYARLNLTSIQMRARSAEYRPIECRSLLYLSNLEQLQNRPREAGDYFYQARSVAQQGGFETQFEAMQRDCQLQN